MSLNYSQQEETSYEMLENIAVLRFICIHISKWIIEIFDRNRQNEETMDRNNMKKKKIIKEFEEKCSTMECEDVRLFLFKNIYHHIGSDTGNMLNSNDCCSWILPECVSEKIEVFVFIHTYFLR